MRGMWWVLPCPVASQHPKPWIVLIGRRHDSALGEGISLLYMYRTGTSLLCHTYSIYQSALLHPIPVAHASACRSHALGSRPMPTSKGERRIDSKKKTLPIKFSPPPPRYLLPPTSPPQASPFPRKRHLPPPLHKSTHPPHPLLNHIPLPTSHP